MRIDDSEKREFKLNNNYHSRYARLIMEQEPELAGIFELRKLKTFSTFYDGSCLEVFFTPDDLED